MWQDQDENEFDFETKILKDIKLKAYYLADEVKKFTVSFDTDGGIPEPPSQKVKSGEKAVKPADPVKEGCVFLYVARPR